MRSTTRLAVLAVPAMAVAGCSVTYTQTPGGGYAESQTVVQTPGGFLPFYQAPIGPPAEPPLSAPPAAFGGPTAVPLPNPSGGALDGTYDGTASTLGGSDYGAICPYRFAMTNMHVKNGHVRFARFRGTIGPDGGVRMPDGAFNWITGHFWNGQFTGFYSNRYCAYSLSLERVGP
jgi:hypothetical protein